MTYRLGPTLTLGVGAQNIFNVFPDRNKTVNSFNGIQTFPSQSPLGMNGRTNTDGWRRRCSSRLAGRGSQLVQPLVNVFPPAESRGDSPC